MPTPHSDNFSKLSASIKTLSDGQITLIQESVDAFNRPYINIERNPTSDLVSEKFLYDFGDLLRIHHCYSKQPFSKDKFEYALERVCNINHLNAQLSTTGNPGNDITIDGVGVSLKTQADSSIRVGKVHISKFMELGKGNWSDKIEDLIGLRQQFFNHMRSYDRIFTLRCLGKKAGHYKYELVEIPKNCYWKQSMANSPSKPTANKTPSLATAESKIKLVMRNTNSILMAVVRESFRLRIY